MEKETIQVATESQKKDKYKAQKKYSKKLQERTYNLMIRCYIGQDDEIIEFAKNTKEKNSIVKSILKEYIANHKK